MPLFLPTSLSSSSSLLFFLSLCSTTTTTAQQQAPPQIVEGWSDDYKLDYSYDPLGNNGPEEWSKVEPDSVLGWGEWETVGTAAGTDDGGGPMLDWSVTTSDVNVCGQEARPSPIELIPSAACTDTSELKVRLFNPSMDCFHPLDLDQSQRQEDATEGWDITPYSLRYYYPRTNTCRKPTVRLDGMMATTSSNNNNRNIYEEHWVLLWLEVHARSEHVVNGKRYDAELQMIHMGTTRPNEFVIVSVLIDASSGAEDHVDFQRYLLDGWQRKAVQEETECNTNKRQLLRGEAQKRRRQQRGLMMGALQDYYHHHHNMTTADSWYYEEDRNNNNQQNEPQQAQEQDRNLQGGNNNNNRNRCTTADQYGNGCQDMGMGPRKRTFPYNLWPSVWYYSYEGSLTAPPCQGNVHWRIMDTPLIISRRQYKQLTHLLTQSRDEKCRIDTATNLQGENFRPLQNPSLSTVDSVNRQGGKNDNNNADATTTNNNGPQVVSHCTSANFFVTVYAEGDR